MLAEADAMVVAGEAARAVVLAEVISRGEVGSGPQALSPVQWLHRHARRPAPGVPRRWSAVARSFAVPGLGAVEDAVVSGVLPVRSAAVVIGEADKLLPVMVEEARPKVVRA